MQKIVFVSGKGGVGKSIYSASLPYKYSQMGLKTLLVELGDISFYKEFFSLSRVEYFPSPISANLDIALWAGGDCLKEYALHLIKSETLYKIFFENKVSQALLNIAPALPELAILGKITSGPRRHGPPVNHQVIVVDCYSSGHFMALLRAPRGLAEAVKFGPMGEQSRSIHKTICDSSICSYHLVTIAEELPVKETQELKTNLEVEFGIFPEIIFNKFINSQLTEDELSSAKQDLKTDSNEYLFLNFLSSLLERQNKFKSQIQYNNCLSLVNTGDPWELIKKLSLEINLTEPKDA